MPHRPRAKGRASTARCNRRERFQEAHALRQPGAGRPLQRKMYQKLGAACNQPPNALLISIKFPDPADKLGGS